MERVLFGGNEPNAHCETTTRTNPENFAVHGGLIGGIHRVVGTSTFCSSFGGEAKSLQ